MLYFSYYKNLDIPISDSEFYGLVKHWLASKKNNDFTEDIVWSKNDNGEDIITAFRLLIIRFSRLLHYFQICYWNEGCLDHDGANRCY